MSALVATIWGPISVLLRRRSSTGSAAPHSRIGPLIESASRNRGDLVSLNRPALTQRHRRAGRAHWFQALIGLWRIRSGRLEPAFDRLAAKIRGRAFIAICFKSWTKGGDVAGSFVNAAATLPAARAWKRGA